MRKIIFMHQTVTNHDAIGNDIEKMYQLLSDKSDCYVYAINQFHTGLRYIEQEALRQALHVRDTVIIYHHSGYWELGEQLLDECECQIIIRYHNITPPVFFEPYNAFHYSQCKLGREQTERLIQKFNHALWLSDSAYNQQDIHDIDAQRLFICPPFHKLEEWKKTVPDERVLRELTRNKCLQVLFVGRVAPNKGHLFMLDILNCYCENYDSSILLRIVGKPDDLLITYSKEIEQRIQRYELNMNVKLIGEINDATLLSYYLGSDVFLCVSEHEGFCVPILEAQCCELPIIARATSAVPDTLGADQLLLEEDPREYAAALHEMRTNPALADYLRIMGKRNYEMNYSNEKITNIFVKFMEEIVGVSV